MKKIYLLLSLMILAGGGVFSQATFSTGAMDVNVNTYGRIRLLSPGGSVRHLQRASILVGTSSSEVFDYTNDAEPLEAAALVSNPTWSDFEIYGSIDNTYSNLPPNVIVKIYAYGWTNQAYTIVKFNVKNAETTPITASIGLDIIPELNQEYGFDTVTYNSVTGVARFHRGTDVNMGVKLLSASLSTLYSFEWFSGYTTDANYWTWMSNGALQSQYASNTDDGPVTITSQAPVVINPGESVDLFYAFALGVNQQAMLAGISAASEKYASLFVSLDDLQANNKKFKLEANYPNPFSSSTTIAYNLPSDGFVSLKVYDALGNEVTTLVNQNQTEGSHTYEFNTKQLAGGVYYYTLIFNDSVKTNKMLLVR
ncbi:MAG: T9SS type A sorting domain-containing protein [Bacteroidales bacterium]|nr:T9SS type A sorting domain-containing protein [Bacteroidales bacterium]